MPDFNARNERIKREYFRFLAEANRKAPSTIDAVRMAITRFEQHTGYKDLATFTKEQAMSFKRELASTGGRAGQPLSKSTMNAVTNALKGFYRWLYSQRGYRSRIVPTDIDYLNLSEKDVRAAKQPAVKRFPTLEQIRHVIPSMPTTTVVQRRNRALLAFTIVTGMRDDAIASVRLKHVDSELRRRDPDLRWRCERSFPSRSSPTSFPSGLTCTRSFSSGSANCARCICSEMMIRSFRKPRWCRTESNALPPTAFERSLLGQCRANKEHVPGSLHCRRACSTSIHTRSATRSSAWARNSVARPRSSKPGARTWHEEMITTFRSYGHLDPTRQGEIINALGNREPEDDRMEKLFGLLEKIAEREKDGSEGKPQPKA